MKNKSENLLPKIAAKGGTVHRQFVRCGKAVCRCARGELHGAYYYHFVRVSGRLQKRYLKPGAVEAVLAVCKARREVEGIERARVLFARKSIRDIRQRLNDVIQEIGLTLGR